MPTVPGPSTGEGRTGALAHLGPNWFAAVMGTGIVPVAAVTLPAQVPGLRTFAVGVWVLAAVLLALLLAATAAHWLRHPAQARAHLFHPVMGHFYGAPPMAMLTVGTGALLVGKDLLGYQVALGLDWVLWTAGTLTGLLATVIVPAVAVTRHGYPPGSAFGGWLMPVVPPMVSAATGALLVTTMGPGRARESLLVGCYALFGLSLVASLIVIPLIVRRLLRHDVGTAAGTPTLWIVLGPLGQSITAAYAMGVAAHGVLSPSYAAAATRLGLYYGLVSWGLAMVWLGIIAAITVRTARRHLPFSLTWWSFTFPVGTVVTGTSGLAAGTGTDLFADVAVALFVFLLGAWATVLVRTVRGLALGRLLVPAAAAASAS